MFDKLNAKFGDLWSYTVRGSGYELVGRITVYSRASDDAGLAPGDHVWLDDTFIERFHREAVGTTDRAVFEAAARRVVGED